MTVKWTFGEGGVAAASSLLELRHWWGGFQQVYVAASAPWILPQLCRCEVGAGTYSWCMQYM
jgi:hypothetical protein